MPDPAHAIDFELILEHNPDAPTALRIVGDPNWCGNPAKYRDLTRGVA